ncbi:MAG: ABC transporter permease, partial [Acidobacteriaceae bacterium]|nr:ABC transporter permease [Acidobacteriaceae bacterium]
MQDLRLAFRLLWRSRIATSISLLSIALTVGAVSVVFAAIKSVILDPLPYHDPERLIQFRSEFPGLRQQPNGDWVVWNDMQEIRRRSRTLQSIGVYGNAVFDLAGDGSSPPVALYGLRVTPDLLSTLGVTPLLGRLIQPGDDQPGRDNEMLLSYGLWKTRFHSEPGIVGRSVTTNGHACLVIGVMPHDFNFPMRRQAAHTPSPYVEFWAPLVDRAPENSQAGFGAVARLRPGVSLSEAQHDLASISNTLQHDFPALNRDRVITAALLPDRVAPDASRALFLLFGAALLFLLIACSNVANLLLARTFERQREMVIRFAIGARRSRVVRQLLTESIVLALAGGLAGYLLTVVAWRVLPALAPASIPRLAAARADWTVFCFALLLAVMNGLLFGIIPALRCSGTSLNPGLFSLKSGSTARHDYFRSALVMAEVAISVVLVMTGGRLLDNFARLVSTNPGFETNHVIASVVLPAVERYRDPHKRAVFYQRIVDAVRALPGIEGAGTVDALPFSGENHGGSVSAHEYIQGRHDALTAEIDVVGADYLRTMGVQLLQGRWFRADEMSESGDSAIIDQRVAARLW